MMLDLSQKNKELELRRQEQEIAEANNKEQTRILKELIKTQEERAQQLKKTTDLLN